MGRTVLAVVLGFVTMYVLMMGASSVTGAIFLGDSFVPSSFDEAGLPKLPMDYLVANLACFFLSALAGGFLTAWIAAREPLRHGHYLSILVLVLGAIRVLFVTTPPAWYLITAPVVAFFGVRLGARLRARGKT
jgi:hypothetical protein